MSGAIHRYVYPLGTVPGGQDTVNLNWLQNPFMASALVDIVSGSAEYSLEFTADDTSGEPSAIRWIELPSAPAGQHATAGFKIDFPVTAIRLNLAHNTGEVRLTVIQAPGSL